MDAESGLSPSPLFTAALEALAGENEEDFCSLLKTHPELASERGEYQLTLLHEAASKNRLKAVQALLDLGVSPNIRGNGDGTPVQWAASLGHLEVVKHLVERGGDPSLEDGLGEGGTALIHALFYGQAETASWLAKSSRAPDNFRVAAGLGDLDSLERLIGTAQAGVSRQWYRPHSEFPDWKTSDRPQEIIDEAFIYACANGQLAGARWLLDHGADVNGKPWYAPALHFAHWQKREDIVRWLVEEAGADLAIRDDIYDAHPWHWAHYTGQPDLAVWLAEKAQSFEAELFLEKFPKG